VGVILLWVGVFPRESLNPVRVALIPGKFPGIMFAGWLPQARARGMADLKTVFDPKKGADELATTDTGLDEIEELRPRMRRCQYEHRASRPQSASCIMSPPWFTWNQLMTEFQYTSSI
jgi:hypothetical protein